MRKLIFLFLLSLALTAKAQTDDEDFYSEKDLQSNLQQAKTLIAQLDATGRLAVHYKKRYEDSLANVYIKKVYVLAENSKDAQLMARALWWDNYCDASRYLEGSIEKANKYLNYSQQHNLVNDEIFARLSLSDIYIHRNLSLAEQNALSAQTLLDNWKKDTLGKDSVKLELYSRLAHAYIHKNDGVKTARYLLPLQNYALQSGNESLKIRAIDILAWMYFEWEGKKALPWFDREYAYFKKIKQPNMLLKTVLGLAMLYRNLGNKEQAEIYFNEEEKLQDSLKVYNIFSYELLVSRYYLGLISLQQYIQTLDSHFNNHLFLPEWMTANTKAEAYLGVNQLDSAWRYLSIAKKLNTDSNHINDINRRLSIYYNEKKDYNKLIPLIQEMVKSYEKQGDLDNTLSQYARLSRKYAIIHDYKAAYENLDKAYHLRDSVDQLKNEEEVANMEMQKQLEIQEAALNEQKRQQEEEKRRIAFQNNVRLYSLLSGVAILILITGILWRSNRRKQKDKLKIQQAYTDLESTQAQLIQSEKMASLGELTAGIAHEIQNPLNFVNNFSEVNTELVDELKAERLKPKAERDEQLQDEILNDIKDNEQKINHHGKRADAIVKGMLQHSRSSSGVKEPTNINALADEYLRLAYHGLRAKDNSFNAAMKTDYDKTIGNINIIPQDIGRVILNLITNAFYAVNEKKKTTGVEYEPTVTISSKKLNDKVEIEVKDNGNGIPQKVLEKIFQPFFTTKPTGQGTGLGLSLAYDIVKAQGGEIKVESKEGEGSEFIIKLPLLK